MKASARIVLVLLTLVACVGCDQSTKSVAKHHLAQDSAVTFLDGSVRLQLAHNEGAFLSLGASLPAEWRQGLLLIGVGCLLSGLLAYTLLARQMSRTHVLAFALMVGGGVSNLIDRVAYGGYVVDFINVGIGSLRTGIFNVADMAISLGVILLLAGPSIDKLIERKLN